MRVGLALMLLCACGGGGKSPGDANDGRQTVVSLPATMNRNLDLLFVIDDSGSMTTKQTNLAVNFPNLINVLNANIEGGFPDVHIGVVTTDMGTKGTAVLTPAPRVGTVGQGGCDQSGKDGVLQTSGAAVSGTFISDIKQADGTRLKNYTGNLADVFAQMAKVGSTGCGFEQPLHAMKRALENPQNAGFLRSDAVLGVVFLTDEDDCTVHDPAILQAGDTGPFGPLNSFRCTRFGVTCAQGGETTDAMNVVGAKSGCTPNTTAMLIDDVTPFRDFLLTLKADARKLVVAGIIGDPEPFAVETRSINGTPTTALAHSCSLQTTNGADFSDPGARMKAFFDLFGDRGTFSSICQADLSLPLETMGLLITRAIGSPCVTASLSDVDPMAGLQVDCVVTDNDGASATEIPKCNSPDQPPCWKLETDATACPAGDHFKLTVVRSSAPSPTTVTTMRCKVL